MELDKELGEFLKLRNIEQSTISYMREQKVRFLYAYTLSIVVKDHILVSD